MTNVLIIGYVWPEPDSSAAGSRMMQLIEFFISQDWQVTFASPAAESEHRFAFESLGVKKESIKVNSECFDTFIETLKPDIVLFDRFIMEEQFGWRVDKTCPAALKLLETVDLHCLREARHTATKHQRQYTRQDLFSDYEMTLLEQEFKVDASLLLHLPFMLENIDSTEIKALPDFEQRSDFISIGNFRHAPNWDAVLYLKQTIWPLIHKKLPQAEIHIYGAYPPPKATQLDNPKEKFRVLGWAENAADVMSKARVCLAPLRFGAGLKGKLLDAMQFGTPSVTTDIGAEGMHGELAWNGVINNNPADIAAAAITLYNDKDAWRTAQANGFKIFNRFYNKDIHTATLLNRINDIKNDLDKHRLNNFTGAMLRHHSMKSTQYMAQWIEAKNRVTPE